MADDNEESVRFERRDYSVQLTDHEMRIRTLERDHSRMLDTQTRIAAALHEVQTVLAGLTTEMKSHVLLMAEHIKTSLAEHERREFTHQRTVLVWVISILVSGMGAIAWLLYQHVVPAIGGS